MIKLYRIKLSNGKQYEIEAYDLIDACRECCGRYEFGPFMIESAELI